jgi:hypothetical protein
VATVPHLRERLESIKYKINYVAKYPELMADIACVQQAVDDLTNNTSFLLLLKVILEIGNFLNGGTFRGRAAGFKLASLATV